MQCLPIRHLFVRSKAQHINATGRRQPGRQIALCTAANESVTSAQAKNSSSDAVCACRSVLVCLSLTLTRTVFVPVPCRFSLLHKKSEVYLLLKSNQFQSSIAIRFSTADVAVTAVQSSRGVSVSPPSCPQSARRTSGDRTATTAAAPCAVVASWVCLSVLWGAMFAGCMCGAGRRHGRCSALTHRS